MNKRSAHKTFKEAIIALDDRFGSLSMYRQEMEQLLINASVDVDSPLKEKRKLYGGPLYKNVFPIMLHATIWVMMAFFFEKEMRNLCGLMGNIFKTNVSLSDLSGNWVERYRKYILKVVGLPIVPSDTMWQDLMGFYEIRNCIVHNLGELEGYPNRKIIEQFCLRNKAPNIINGTLIFNDVSSINCQGIIGSFIGCMEDAIFEKLKHCNYAE